MPNIEILIKYHDGQEKIEKIPVGDWIDLRSVETVHMEKGDFNVISLGVSMKLPDGYEAWILPRSSTFRRWGIIMACNMGIIDNSYCGNNDIWGFPAIALRRTSIFKGDRICQFRIMKKMPSIDFIEVDNMEDPDRGGFGSTGDK